MYSLSYQSILPKISDLCIPRRKRCRQSEQACGTAPAQVPRMPSWASWAGWAASRLINPPCTARPRHMSVRYTHLHNSSLIEAVMAYIGVVTGCSGSVAALWRRTCMCAMVIYSSGQMINFLRVLQVHRDGACKAGAFNYLLLMAISVFATALMPQNSTLNTVLG